MSIKPTNNLFIHCFVFESMAKIKVRKNKIVILALLPLVVIICSAFLINFFIKKSEYNNEILKNIKLPPRFKIDIFASDFGSSLISYPGPNSGVRFMEFYDGVLFVSAPSQGKIYALPDRNNDGKADEKIVVIDGLNRPHGIAFYNDWMYAANEGSIIRVTIGSDFKAIKESLEHIADLPTGGHWTRTLRIHDGNLYVSI